MTSEAAVLEKFGRNQHGHFVITITGLDLTGGQEIERLKAQGYYVGINAQYCLLSTNPDGYDANHRLVGTEYKVVLVPGWEIERDSERTTQGLIELGVNRYGYSRTLAGIMPRIRQAVSRDQMKEMRFSSIVGFHDPIKNPRFGPFMLESNGWNCNPSIDAYLLNPDTLWYDSGAFAFLLPAR